MLIFVAARVTPGLAAVRLVSFTATPGDQKVELQWETATETGTAGFFVQRRQSNTEAYQRISSFIPVTGEGVSGSVYDYVDNGLTNGVTYHYRLEEINSNQTSEYPDLGQASATAGGSPAAATATATATHSPTATWTASATTGPTSTRPPGTATPTFTRTATYNRPAASASPTVTPQPSPSPSPSPLPSLSATFSPSPTAVVVTSTATLPAPTLTATATTVKPSAVPAAGPVDAPEETNPLTLVLAGLALVAVLGAGGWFVWKGRVK